MGWTADQALVAPLTAKIKDLLADESRCVADLAAYFDPKGGFSGGAFERIGANARDADEIGSYDILAVTMLSVTVPGVVTRDLLLDSDLQFEVTKLLGTIRSDVDLWDDGVEPDLDAANALWDLIKDRAHELDQGAADATLSKLLAHKRPRLVPISDSVVMENLPVPSGVNDRWIAYRTILRDEPVIIERLASLAAQVPDASVASTLRVLDVVAWMRFRRNASS